MAAAILSQDILAICLLLAEGNIDLSMEEVIHRAENFQEDQDRHFGITRSDFRGLFNYWFMFDLAIIHFDDGIDGIKLKDIVIYLGDVCIVRNGGRAHDYIEADGQRIMDEEEITITVLLGRGEASEQIITCDFSYDYVRINAEYRT